MIGRNHLDNRSETECLKRDDGGFRNGKMPGKAQIHDEKVKTPGSVTLFTQELHCINHTVSNNSRSNGK